MILLVTGGSGSGKSAYAENRILEYQDEKRFYLATMKVYGEEGRRKVEKHHALRAGKGFVTIEQPTNLSRALPEISPKSAVLLECMSNLVANEMFGEQGEMRSAEQVVEKIASEVREIAAAADGLVIVTNNVFEDGISYDATTKEYMHALAEINRKLALLADEVVEVVVGIPVVLKEGGEKNETNS